MIYLFLGKGGVGKSTATARYARRFLDEGRSVVAISLDPSQGLLFYLRDLCDHPDLTLIAFDGNAAAARAVEKNGPVLAQIVAAGTLFGAQDLSKLLSQSWPGADEWLGASELVHLAETPDTTILVDLAPGPHARQFLAAPARLGAWLRFLDALMDRHRYLRQRLGGGDPDGDPLEQHLAALGAHHDRMTQIFEDRLNAILITTPDDDALHTARLLLDSLKEHGVPVERLLLNRFQPHHSSYLEAASTLAAKVEIWLEEPHPPSPVELHDLVPTVPPESLTVSPRGLHFISGKGGSGKSHLAHHIAQTLCRQSILTGLISLSDEGHGDLSNEHLRALRIDPDAEVLSLMEALRHEWSRALRPPPGLAIPFEEEVVDRLLALHPPGFEVLSLALAIGSELLDDPQRVWIVDGPSTGHLLRLWDALNASEPWLNAALTLLDTQAGALSLPRMTRRLLRWRRGFRRFREVITDPETGHLWITCTDGPVARSQARFLASESRRHCWHPRALVPLHHDLHQEPHDG